MAAEVLVEIYRTNEVRSAFTFDAVVTISYFGDTARLSGMSGSFSHYARKEVQAYLLKRGVKEVHYIRRGKHVVINRR
jgi:hypothetical protein